MVIDEFIKCNKIQVYLEDGKGFLISKEEWEKLQKVITISVDIQTTKSSYWNGK